MRLSEWLSSDFSLVYVQVCILLFDRFRSQLKALKQTLEVQGAAAGDVDERDAEAPATPARTPLRSGSSSSSSSSENHIGRSSSGSDASNNASASTSSGLERRAGGGPPASAAGSKRPPNGNNSATIGSSSSSSGGNVITPNSLKIPAGPERDLCKELATRLEALLGENASLRARVEFLESTVRDLSGTLEERKELLLQVLQTQSPSSAAGGINGSSLLDPVAMDARVKSLVSALKGLTNASEVGDTTAATAGDTEAPGAEPGSNTGAMKSPFGASPSSSSSSFSALQAFSPPAKLFSITPEQSLIEVVTLLCLSLDIFSNVPYQCSHHSRDMIKLIPKKSYLPKLCSCADHSSRKYQTSAETCCCGPYL